MARSQSVSHYHTPSRELMTRTLTYSHESGYGEYLCTLDQGKYRVLQKVMFYTSYLLRFFIFLTMPSRRDTHGPHSGKFWG